MVKKKLIEQNLNFNSNYPQNLKQCCKSRLGESIGEGPECNFSVTSAENIRISRKMSQERGLSRNISDISERFTTLISRIIRMPTNLSIRVIEIKNIARLSFGSQTVSKQLTYRVVASFIVSTLYIGRSFIVSALYIGRSFKPRHREEQVKPFQPRLSIDRN